MKVFGRKAKIQKKVSPVQEATVSWEAHLERLFSHDQLPSGHVAQLVE